VFRSQQGKAQDIAIQGLIGDRFTVNQDHDTSGLIGLAYLFNGLQKNNFSLDYGVNAFYLANTSVNGTIIQEYIFSNLAYQYDINHMPVYLAAKGRIDNSSSRFAITFDGGVGPNFSKTSGYRDWSIDDGITLPDYAFSGRSSTQFSATAGIGLQIKQVIGDKPLGCGYRFFYLGKSDFNKRTEQILNTLNTGVSRVHALVCDITL
jgi:hypothetical protein